MMGNASSVHFGLSENVVPELSSFDFWMLAEIDGNSCLDHFLCVGPTVSVSPPKLICPASDFAWCDVFIAPWRHVLIETIWQMTRCPIWTTIRLWTRIWTKSALRITVSTPKGKWRYSAKRTSHSNSLRTYSNTSRVSEKDISFELIESLHQE